MNWAMIIGASVQLVFLILKNKFEHDEAEKKRKEELYAQWTEAVKSGDHARITALLDRLRK